MTSIDGALKERDDLSAFIVHLTKGDDDQAFANLVSMLTTCRIEAQGHFGMPTSRMLANSLTDTAFAQTQRAVCFTETPITSVRLLCNRRAALREYGVAFPKTYARRQGVNPLWYLDTTKGGRHEWLTRPFLELVREAIDDATPLGETEPDPDQLAKHPIFRLTPFVQTMSAHRESEREWRKVGDLQFLPQAAVVAILPEADHERLADVLAALDGYRRIKLVDANWERDRIEETLAGVRQMPFPQ